jgi:hypothetical protein
MAQAGQIDMIHETLLDHSRDQVRAFETDEATVVGQRYRPVSSPQRNLEPPHVEVLSIRVSGTLGFVNQS